MPNCPQPPGVACTKTDPSGKKIGRYQDPKTKEVGFGDTYEAARKNARDKAKLKTTNPDSGCQNCKEGDWWCEFMKFGCEVGHGTQETAENSIPMIAIAGGAILILIIALR